MQFKNFFASTIFLTVAASAAVVPEAKPTPTETKDAGVVGPDPDVEP